MKLLSLSLLSTALSAWVKWRIVAGALLVAASFVIWGVTEGSGQQGVYVPPHVENGRVVPGHVDTGAPK